ncbi:hypothetical protein FQZ97_815610 [compost metagenome]
MWRTEQVGQGRKVQFRRWWFGHEDIQGRSGQVTIPQLLNERLFIDYAASCGVDEACTRFEPFEPSASDETEGLRGARAVEGEEVDCLQRIVQVGYLAGAWRDAVGRQVGVEDVDLHPEG